MPLSRFYCRQFQIASHASQFRRFVVINVCQANHEHDDDHGDGNADYDHLGILTEHFRKDGISMGADVEVQSV
jgi:hypothetical protein